MDRIRVLLADDDVGYVTSLATYLRLHDDLEVLPVSTDGDQAVESYEQARPDVLVMDVVMPVLDGVSAASAISSAHPGARIIMVSAHGGVDLAERSREAGALAFLPKWRASEELVDAIRGAVSGPDARPPGEGVSAAG